MNDILVFEAAEVTGSMYWRNPFHPISSPKSLVSFTVMENEPVTKRHVKSGEGMSSNKVSFRKENRVFHTFYLLC